MNKSKSARFQSALIVSKYFFVAAFVLALAAWWLSADAIAALLMTICFVGIVSYLWGKASLSKVNAGISAKSMVLSVGQSAEVNYEISNDKLIPLVWLEMSQAPPKNECMEPDSSMIRKTLSEEEAKEANCSFYYAKRFAFLLGHQKLSWKCRFEGKRRGIYRMDEFKLKSGDGFGLTQSEIVKENPGKNVFVVWPKIVPVRTRLLFQNVWNGNTGKKGWVEDPTILLSERPYEEGDSWKRIDWRTAARTDELYTKQYEMIRPESFMFIMDTASFNDKEEALSILGSILHELYLNNTGFGIVLPRTIDKECVIKPVSEYNSLEECMYEISDHNADAVSADGFSIGEIAPFCEKAGQLYIITKDEMSKRTSDICTSLSVFGPRFICKEETPGAISFEMIKEGSL